jgi:hypothetical protein
MNGQAAWDEYVECIDALIASGEYRSRADAGDEVRRRFPHLANVKFPSETQSGATGAASTAGNAEAQLNEMAKKISAERGVSFAQAYVHALKANPSLYVQYLKQHDAAVAAARRG